MTIKQQATDLEQVQEQGVCVLVDCRSVTGPEAFQHVSSKKEKGETGIEKREKENEVAAKEWKIKASATNASTIVKSLSHRHHTPQSQLKTR